MTATGRGTSLTAHWSEKLAPVQAAATLVAFTKMSEVVAEREKSQSVERAASELFVHAPLAAGEEEL
jgi:hypothetical protein